ncbi:MAG TPA: aminoacyl--tRNA ligase-related protein [Candidatus Paceibacterota bacterium]|nr:aminoacyl--tRNA ligase-related protein [Candidatus Paceibacterota bacterium]
MRQSHLFTKTRKQAPKDEVAKNAQLLIRAGYIHKEMAGVYSFLPLGIRVLSKIEHIIREEMNKIGGQEIRMATLHPSENWKQTGGWDGVDVLFKIQSRTEKEYALGQSEEEIVTPIAQEYAPSHKDLPIAIYQIGQKYRDELRAKSGIMRGREFGMKDMYSFHTSQADFDRFYEIAKAAYLKVFERVGLVAKVTEASGGAFSEKLSYEFMVLTDAGEDDIVYCESCTHCANVEISKQQAGEMCPKCGKSELKAGKAAEVGNVFDLGQKYPKAFGYTYKDEDGKGKTPIMGCYGIGTSRLMGTIVEVLADEKGIVWPAEVSPFRAHLVCVSGGNAEVMKEADRLYELLRQHGIDVLYDDREMSAGAKFADAELIGIPVRLVVSEKTVSAGGVEMVMRKDGTTSLVPDSQVVERLAK